MYDNSVKGVFGVFEEGRRRLSRKTKKNIIVGLSDAAVRGQRTGDFVVLRDGRRRLSLVRTLPAVCAREGFVECGGISAEIGQCLLEVEEAGLSRTWHYGTFAYNRRTRFFPPPYGTCMTLHSRRQLTFFKCMHEPLQVIRCG